MGLEVGRSRDPSACCGAVSPLNLVSGPVPWRARRPGACLGSCQRSLGLLFRSGLLLGMAGTRGFHLRRLLCPGSQLCKAAPLLRPVLGSQGPPS